MVVAGSSGAVRGSTTCHRMPATIRDPAMCRSHFPPIPPPPGPTRLLKRAMKIERMRGPLAAKSALNWSQNWQPRLCPEGVLRSILSDQRVSIPVRNHSGDRCREGLPTSRTVELCVAESENPSIARHHPVAVPARRRKNGLDRLVEADASHRAIEASITKGEYPTVGSNEPVAATAWRNRHPGNRLIQGRSTRRPMELSVSEREDSAVSEATAAPGRGSPFFAVGVIPTMGWLSGLPPMSP